ncbi:MAG TPA: glycosyl hydrolase family 28-related protein [Prolixibacteraceae bacterium]|nr:glycosyl hydrolase family 28-related protein [Prolixibacteraceae bacterium]
MKTKLLSLLLLTVIGCNHQKENRITSYGAVADGTTNNAHFIQQAIDEVSAAGGGQVIVPPGNFMTSTVWLKSGVDLHLVPSSIVGIPGYPVQDVTLENIEITYGGMASKEIAWIPLNKITSIPENEANYPEFSMWGELPAWGFYIRHAEGIKMKNIKVSYLKEDFRPALVFDDVKGIEMSNFKIPTARELPVVLFNNTTGIVLNNLEMPVSEEIGVVKTNFK